MQASSPPLLDSAEPVPFRPRSRAVALLLGLVPGWGHVYWGRERLGLAIFTLFAPALFALIHGVLLYVGPYSALWRASAVTVLVLVFAVSYVDLVMRTTRARAEREKDEWWSSIRRGMVSFVRGDLAGARSEFGRAHDVDPFDPESQFRLGIVYAREGDRRQAARWLRRAERYDVDEKWAWEIARERLRLSHAGRSSSASSDGAPEGGADHDAVGGDSSVRTESERAADESSAGPREHEVAERGRGG